MKIKMLLWAAAISFTACTCSPKDTPDKPEEKDGTVHVTGVAVTRANLELNVGEGFLLGARVTPKNATNPTVTWSSDNVSVATVEKESGQVKAIAAGNAVITVTTVDGGFTATCPVTVKGGDTPPDPTPIDPGAPAAFGAVPTAGQLAWQRQELLMFYHYGQATFSGWDGENASCNGKTWSESLLLKNYKPGTINADQWVKTARDNGFGEVILTAKHHDGFCLWDNPESTTDVANTACSNHTDVVQAVRDACTKYGVNLGLYLSPWDRMIEVSGKTMAEYEAMYKNALKDLMTRYAPVTEMWFDGNHAGNFNWEAVNSAVLDVNPECVIFSNGGPGCRWVGNEAGVAGETDWATLDIAGRGLSPSNLPGNYESYLGSGDKGAASWCPAESDFSAKAGMNSVLLDAKELKIIEDFTKMRTAVFTVNLADGATATASSVRGDNPDKYGPAKMLDGDYDSYFATDDAVRTVDIEFQLSGNKNFNRVMLQEYIPLGQRVERFDIQVRENGTWKSWGTGTKSTIGHKRIILGKTVTADAVRLSIQTSLACPVLNGFGLYNDTVSGL